MSGVQRLVAEYGGRLYSAAFILEQEPHSAEDLVSRTMCRAVEKIDRYDPAYSFWNWLYTIMLNLYRTDRRKCRAEVAECADFVERRLESQSADVCAEMRLSGMDVELLRTAVARLPPSLRTVVMLRYFEDKTLSEMVKIMGVPSGTVKCRLHRARLRLKTLLSALFEEGGQTI